jgi:hypothetical protein
MTLIESQITAHEKALRVLQMISKADERFVNRIKAHQGIFGTSRDYRNAQIGWEAKKRLTIYYEKLIVGMAAQTLQLN